MKMAYIITSPIQYNTIHTAILIYIAMVNRSSISGCPHVPRKLSSIQTSVVNG